MVAVALLQSGCARQYYLSSDALDEAKRAVDSGAPPRRVAIAALSPDHEGGLEHLYLRYARIPWDRVQPEEPNATIHGRPVRVRDSRSQRHVGLALLACAALHIAVIGALVANDYSHRNDVMGDGWPAPSLYVGVPLGVTAMPLLAAGVSLIAEGYGASVDVAPGKPSMLYFGSF